MIDLDPSAPAADTLAVLARLISFDTTSRHSNVPLIADVAARLAGLGVVSRLVYSSPDKVNLIATIGPEGDNGVILSGHTDVVPVDGQAWTRPPFDLTLEGGRAYGRGTTDMKGFVAAVLAKVPQMRAAPLKRPIHIVLSHDEETGCWGVVSLLEALAGENFRAEVCLVGEPTSMQVVVAHKGKKSVRVHVSGRACHSSLAPQGVNALEYAARLVTFISDIGRRLAATGARDPLYDLSHSTAHVGVLRSGSVLNIVPHEAVFEFEFRTLPIDDVEALHAEVVAYAREVLEPAMRAVDPTAGIRFEVMSAIPGLDTDPEAPVVHLAKRLTERNDHAKVAYGTEAGQFASRLGAPAVVVGPGAIAQAHTPDEYIEISELIRCERFLDRLIAWCCETRSA